MGQTRLKEAPRHPPISDVQALRRRAREQMEAGAITPSYGADRDAVIGVLNAALATEIVCVLRYKRHYFMARGIDSDAVRKEFRQHATEEQTHADQIAERIVQLGGEPDLDPHGLAMRAHSEYIEGETLVEMIMENLVAERIAVESYREIVAWLSGRDPTTRRMMEEILAEEEEHAEDLNALLMGLRT